jgi:hypothetical protein
MRTLFFLVGQIPIDLNTDEQALDDALACTFSGERSRRCHVSFAIDLSVSAGGNQSALEAPPAQG